MAVDRTAQRIAPPRAAVDASTTPTTSSPAKLSRLTKNVVVTKSGAARSANAPLPRRMYLEVRRRRSEECSCNRDQTPPLVDLGVARSTSKLHDRIQSNRPQSEREHRLCHSSLGRSGTCGLLKEGLQFGARLQGAEDSLRATADATPRVHALSSPHRQQCQGLQVLTRDACRALRANPVLAVTSQAHNSPQSRRIGAEGAGKEEHDLWLLGQRLREPVIGGHLRHQRRCGRLDHDTLDARVACANHVIHSNVDDVVRKWPHARISGWRSASVGSTAAFLADAGHLRASRAAQGRRQPQR